MLTSAAQSIPSAWQRSMLSFFLLAELSGGARHGYALVKALQERGLSPIKGATLYPALAKLEAAAQVSTSWEEGQGGPGRKVYSLTAAGQQQLAALQQGFGQLSTVVDSF